MNHFSFERLIPLLFLFLFSHSVAMAQNSNQEEYAASEKEVRTELEAILQDPRFAPKRTWAQWLGLQMDDWDWRIRNIPDLPISSFWAGLLFWIFIGWCVLTLIAILLHLLWTLGVWPKPRRQAKQTQKINTNDSIETWYQSAYDQLMELMQWCEQQEQFEEALHVQRIALLKKCEENETLRFHPSKTNGDYRGEFPMHNPFRTQFQHYLNGFDRFVYGTIDIDSSAYQKMKSLFQDMTQDEPARSTH